MDYKPLLPEKQSSGDEGRAPRPEQLRYHSNATWFSKLTFGWIFPVIKVTPRPRSTATSRTSSRTTSRTSRWRSSRSRSTASGTRTGRRSRGPILTTRSSNRSSRPSTVVLPGFRAVHLGDGDGLPGLPVHGLDADDHPLHLPDAGESARQHGLVVRFLDDHNTLVPLLPILFRRPRDLPAERDRL